MSVNIQLKHSSVVNKAPQPSDLQAGELALNINAGSPAAYIKDSAGNIVKLAGAGAIGGTPATETAAGIVELATAAETTAGTDNTRAVHPAGLKVELDKKAPLDSPALTGTPTAPTAAAGTDTTQVATTAFVQQEVDGADAPDGGADGTKRYVRQVVTTGTGTTPVDTKTWEEQTELWTRTGTVVSPTNAGDTIQTSGGAVSLDPGTTGSPLVRDSLGRLLIGTSSAFGGQWDSLQIQSNVLPGLAFARNEAVITESNPLGVISFYGNDGGTYELCGKIECTADASHAASSKPSRLVFSTTSDGASSPTERMRIANGGNIYMGDGTSSSLIAYPYGSNGGHLIEWNRAASALTTTAAVFRDGAIVRGSITYTNSATAYNTSSDYRLKENVAPATDGISRLQQLKPSRFNFIADPDTVVDGFLAHEVQTIVPEAITGEKDAVDDEGNPVYQGIDQSKLVPLLTAALQEAVAKIESLEQRLNDAGIN